MTEQKNKGTILWNVPDQEIIDFTAAHEGRSEYFYRDHLGNVTVGYGRMIPNREKARNINFYDRRYEPLQYASDEARKTAFDLVSKQEFGKGISSNRYKPNQKNKLLDLYLSGEEAKRMLREDLENNAKDARKTFSQFDDYPDSAQRALLDMQFNMGINKFQREVVNRNNVRPGWPKLFDAIEAKDWEKAAKESRRKDVIDDRNNQIYQWFMESR